MAYQNVLFDNTYQVIREIGKGGLGTVYLAWHLRLQKYVVLKQVPVQDTYDAERIRIEVDTLKSLHHPNLPQVYDFIPANSCVYTVMDYVEGTDLETYLRQGIHCKTEDVIHWFQQLSEVLVYLHGQSPSVIHSDIKPANIIITPQNNAVLIDFNISLSKRTDTVIGLSMNYASPEQINMMQQQTMGARSQEFLDGRSDIYSLCASFYHLISWKRPSVFYGTEPLKNMETAYPEVFCDILDRGMYIDREVRFSSAIEMQSALNQMWKKTKSYKAYVAAQIGVILMTAVLLAAGVYQLVGGVRTKKYNEFITSYNQCVQMINSKSKDQIIPLCMDFLNRNGKMLKAEPEKKGDILIGLGRSYMDEKDYEEAMGYWKEAAECFASEDDRMVESLSGWICSATNIQNQNEVTAALEFAEDRVEDSDVRLLLEIQAEELQGYGDRCLHLVSELETQSSNHMILSYAYLSAAACEKEEAAVFQWLKKASEHAEEQTDLNRKCGYELLNLGGRTKNNALRKNALETAVTCYEKLIASIDATANDYLNLATALRKLGKYDRSLSVLEELENSKIQEESIGLLYMQKAFTYQEKGEAVRARDFAREAMEHLYEGVVSEEEWQYLSYLAGISQ